VVVPIFNLGIRINKVNMAFIIAFADLYIEFRSYADRMKVIFIEVGIAAKFMNVSAGYPNHFACNTGETVVMRILSQFCKANTAYKLMNVSLFFSTNTTARDAGKAIFASHNLQPLIYNTGIDHAISPEIHHANAFYAGSKRGVRGGKRDGQISANLRSMQRQSERLLNDARSAAVF